jgi:hypothetical protein
LEDFDMNIKRSLLWLALLTGATLALTACSVDIVRNADGSLTATATMTEESLSEELAGAVGPHTRNVAADLHDGYITVSGERERVEQAGVWDEFSFRLDLAAVEGRLDATITEFTVNGQAASDARLARWNEQIARRLERMAGNRPNRRLESVSISETELTMVWHVETARSRQGGG